MPPESRPRADIPATPLRHVDLAGFARLRVLVAGDFMLDEYLWGKVERISPEAPVAVVEVERETRTLGGAGNVVNNLAALGARVEVLGLVGEDHPGRLLRQEMMRLGVAAEGLFTDRGRPTSRKTRVFGNQQQVVRIDRETKNPAGPDFIEAALAFLEARLPAVDAIVLSDYAKGVLTPELLKQLIARGRIQGLPVVVDPKGADYFAYAGASVITPNRKELELVAGFPLLSQDDLVLAGRRLRESLALDAVLVTQGAEGYTLILEEEAIRQPARTPREVFDVSGAGDTVAAVMALGLAGGWDLSLAAALANLAAGVVVTKKGTAPILLSEMQAELHGHVHLQEKMTTLAELRLLVPHLQAQGKRVVFTNGCFDLLHRGHIRFLEAARQLGDVLVVAVDSDESVRQVKGEGRPVIGAEDRKRILAALEAVDYVTVFTSGQLPELLAALKPDVLAKGSNYPEEQVAGREIVTAYGGRVALVPVTDPVSVSEMIQRIRGGKE